MWVSTAWFWMAIYFPFPSPLDAIPRIKGFAPHFHTFSGRVRGETNWVTHSFNITYPEPTHQYPNWIHQPPSGQVFMCVIYATLRNKYAIETPPPNFKCFRVEGGGGLCRCCTAIAGSGWLVVVLLNANECHPKSLIACSALPAHTN